MAHSDSGADAGPHRERVVFPRSVADAGRRLGVALVGAALPAAVATVSVALLGGSVDGSVFHWVETAMETSLRRGTGLPWAFHVSALTVAAGAWVLGFALLVEGYFGLR